MKKASWRSSFLNSVQPYLTDISRNVVVCKKKYLEQTYLINKRWCLLYSLSISTTSSHDLRKREFISGCLSPSTLASLDIMQSLIFRNSESRALGIRLYCLLFESQICFGGYSGGAHLPQWTQGFGVLLFACDFTQRYCPSRLVKGLWNTTSWI